MWEDTRGDQDNWKPFTRMEEEEATCYRLFQAPMINSNEILVMIQNLAALNKTDFVCETYGFVILN